MKRLHLLSLAAACVIAASLARAQSSETAPASGITRGAVPIDRLVAIVAKKSGKRFILDPKVRADVVLIGINASDLTYPEFLTVLEVYGYGAVDDGKLVRIVPDASLRQMAVPTVTAKTAIRRLSTCVRSSRSRTYQLRR